MAGRSHLPNDLSDLSKQLLLHHAQCSMGAQEDSTWVSYGWLWLAMGAMVIPGAPNRGHTFGDDFGARNMTIDVLKCFTESVNVPLRYSEKVRPKSRLHSNIRHLPVERQVLQDRASTQTTSTIGFSGSNDGDGDNYVTIRTCHSDWQHR